MNVTEYARQLLTLPLSYGNLKSHEIRTCVYGGNPTESLIVAHEDLPPIMYKDGHWEPIPAMMDQEANRRE